LGGRDISELGDRCPVVISKRKPPPKTPATIGRKVFAVATLAGVALLFYYLTNLPVAVDVTGTTWEIAVGDDLILRPLGSGQFPLIAIQGADNEGVDVRFDSAQLHPDTVSELHRDFNLAFAAAPAPMAWTTKVKGAGHTMIDFALEAPQGVPEVHIQHIGEGANPGLSMMVHNAQLITQLSVLLGEVGPGLAPEQKTLQIGGERPVVLPGAVPLTVVVVADQQLRLTFPSAAPTSQFHLGAAGISAPTGLPLRDLSIQGSDSHQQKHYACAAVAATHFWAPRDPHVDDCVTAPKLRATELKLESDHATISLAGSAFLIKDGVVVTDDWFTKLDNNKPLAALFALAFTGLAGWVWREFARGRSGSGKEGQD
jgi:hypothetical protein